jgi:hypothetical protein
MSEETSISREVPLLAYEYARECREMFLREHISNRVQPRMPARVEYAVRRVGGLERVDDVAAFVEAYNEAPFVDEWFWDLNLGVVELIFMVEDLLEYCQRKAQSCVTNAGSANGVTRKVIFTPW